METVELRIAIVEEKNKKRAMLTQIAKNLYELGYNTREISAIMGVAESSVLSLVRPYKDYVREE